MSINLVDLVMKQVGGNLPGILGSLLGESADRTQGALAGAVPAILGSLMGVASKGGAAADQLVAAVGDQDDGMLDDLAGMLGGGNHQAIADQGGGLLNSLLGEGVVGSLVGAIGKFSGLGSGSSKSLLGMLVPVVMSVLGRQQKSAGLDASGLMGLLSDQKDNISAAMPSGLANALGGASFMDNLMGVAGDTVTSIGQAASGAAGAAAGAVGSAADAAGKAAGSVASAAGEGAEAAGRAASSVAQGASNVASQAGAAASDAASAGGSWLRWALPLLILLALIWLAFKFLGGGSVEETVSDATDAAGSAVEATTEAASSAVEATTEAASDAADAASEAAGSAVEATTEAASDAADAASEAASGAASAVSDAVTAMVGDVDVGGELTSMFEGVNETLGGITDVASAEAALPKLEELNTTLDSLTGLADQLPTDAVDGLSAMVSDSVSGIDGVMDSLKAIPGVGELIEPIITQIKEKLAAFTTA